MERLLELIVVKKLVAIQERQVEWTVDQCGGMDFGC